MSYLMLALANVSLREKDAPTRLVKGDTRMSEGDIIACLKNHKFIGTDELALWGWLPVRDELGSDVDICEEIAGVYKRRFTVDLNILNTIVPFDSNRLVSPTEAYQPFLAVSEGRVELIRPPISPIGLIWDRQRMRYL